MECLVLKEGALEAALWARSAFDENFLKNTHKVRNFSVRDLSRCDPAQWKDMYGAAQSLFTI